MSMRSIVRSTLTALCICLASYFLIAAYAHFWLTEPNYKLGQVIHFNNPNDKFTNEILSQGWATPEPWGVWSKSEKAILIFLKPDPKATKLIIHARAFINVKIPVQHINVQINEQPAVEFALNMADKNIITLSIDSSYRTNEKIQIQMKFSNAASPKELGLGDDSRKIAIGIESLEFR